MNVSITGFGLTAGRGTLGHTFGLTPHSLLMQARAGQLVIAIGYRSFVLDAAQFELTAADTGLYFSGFGPDDFFHTAIITAEDERDMMLLEEVRDALVPVRRIGYP